MCANYTVKNIYLTPKTDLTFKIQLFALRAPPARMLRSFHSRRKEYFGP